MIIIGYFNNQNLFFCVHYINIFLMCVCDTGFSVLHPEDKAFLCRAVTFMSSVLVAGQHRYGPSEAAFSEFWGWNISPRNPFYTFKQRLHEIGDEIRATNMDQYEAAALTALLFLAAGTWIWIWNGIPLSSVVI